MRRLLFILISAALFSVANLFAQEAEDKMDSEKPLLSFGLIADPQAGDKPSAGNRNYRGTNGKLTECVREFNRQMPDSVIVLGDLVDDSEDALFEVIFRLSNLRMPFYTVAGNHDFEAFSSNPQQTYGALTMPDRNYIEKKVDSAGKTWRLIFLDGNRISLYSWPRNSSEYRAAKKYRRKKAPGAPDWNGGVGEEQMLWLKLELQDAEERNEKVLIFCHFPIFPDDSHNLWDAEELLEIVRGRSCVKAWISGHNHKGNTAEDSGILFLTMKGMVEGDQNAFGLLQIYPDRFELEGYGAQPLVSHQIRPDQEMLLTSD